MAKNKSEDLQQFAQRYMEVWNEADDELRQQRIADLWAEDGTQFTASREIHGRQALFERITTNYETFVKGQDLVFRLSGKTDEHHNAVKLNWEMLPANGGAVAGTGLILLLLNADGLINLDYQF
ncbi:nuclear transport factor 2 family protein [Ktedonosporobacter rubrisoli]|uniref:Nuclear transport factor 2 family protein n=1 Tax=Ktedonosporobacter rubrisoli TaxID=2509675 RepID=A0A4P6JRQ4_KTERU|nr:nuclear transport factor 2 family protein [Ktedonosporobacter rubrisoli]QBD78158.1 nuclear transport factor 2 family protein [Ktedonosporobacter rubrisoli]